MRVGDTLLSVPAAHSSCSKSITSMPSIETRYMGIPAASAVRRIGTWLGGKFQPLPGSNIPSRTSVGLSIVSPPVQTSSRSIPTPTDLGGAPLDTSDTGSENARQEGRRESGSQL